MALATVDPQYRAATEDVALLDRSQAGKLALSGPGAIAFLDSVLSNDVAALSAGSGQEAALLTHNGRMLAQVRVLRSDEELLLDTERARSTTSYAAWTADADGARLEEAAAMAGQSKARFGA